MVIRLNKLHTYILILYEKSESFYQGLVKKMTKGANLGFTVFSVKSTQSIKTQKVTYFTRRIYTRIFLRKIVF